MRINPKSKSICYKIVLFTILIFIMLFVTYENFNIFSVSGESMYPKLRSKDLLITNTLFGKRFLTIKRGSIVVLSHPYKKWDKWDKIEPIINRQHVKRAIALPGDTMFIKTGKYCVNSLESYIGDEQMQKCLGENKHITISVDSLLPFAPLTGKCWSIFNMDSIYIPYKGASLPITEKNYNMYKRVIEWETGQLTEFRDNRMFIQNKAVAKYTFENNYYFLGGDNVFESIDSRYWGIIPEILIIGKVLIIIPIEHKFPYISLTCK